MTIINDVIGVLRDASPLTAGEIAGRTGLNVKQVYQAVASHRKQDDRSVISRTRDSALGVLYSYVGAKPIANQFATKGDFVNDGDLYVPSGDSLTERQADVMDETVARINAKHADTDELIAAAAGQEAVSSFTLKMAINMDELILQDADKDVWLATRL